MYRFEFVMKVSSVLFVKFNVSMLQNRMSFRRKRGHDDDEEGQGGFRSKKRRTNEHLEIEDRLESLILRVGEKSTSSLESNLEGLASVLEADLSTYKSKILKILVECAVKLPDKCTIYTTLIGLLNTKNYNFGGECVELLVKSTKVLHNKSFNQNLSPFLRTV